MNFVDSLSQNPHLLKCSYKCLEIFHFLLPESTAICKPLQKPLKLSESEALTQHIYTWSMTHARYNAGQLLNKQFDTQDFL